jgi:hypothetical protein
MLYHSIIKTQKRGKLRNQSVLGRELNKKLIRFKAQNLKKIWLRVLEGEKKK